MNLVDRDKKVIWHPYTQQHKMPDPVPIVRGEGVYLIDEQGHRYIDAISSWWVTIHGHANAYIARKIYEQALLLEQVIFAGFTHEPAVRLAERLLGILPPELGRIFYSDNGSTATEVAIKMALQYWWNSSRIEETNTSQNQSRTKILALKNSYHGDTFGAMSVSARGVFTLAFQDKLFEVELIDPPTDDYELPNLQWNEFACIIYEPLLQGAGGMNMYSKSGLDQLLQKCKSEKIICIADEVMTGFGRTGKLFASEHCVSQPDVICLSKGLTGGTMALGVTACADWIYQAFVSDDKLKTLFHGHSFTANPIACTAALASLDLLESEQTMSAVNRISQQHEEFVSNLRQSSAKNIRQLGTVVAFELDGDANQYLHNSSGSITSLALRHGVYLRPLGNTIYLMPPYCISDEQLLQVYNVVHKLISVELV
ncbi:MAG: adenosylmethionine--8-amino-7-oxononanoate transaminase [Chitinophagaceae bacterium]|nr:adenosylmethionine--8-amino-7-oxononanoate transaminase [Chitinophagaceae bacterium]